MLSKSAFNALLKTLEEPPSHVKFVFATTEIRKVPVTVLSRCQRFDLRRVDAQVLKEHFTRVTALEGADIAITTTPSREPLIRKRHLRPGLHITAMGSDAEHKNEIAADALAALDCYVADRLSQTRVLGELHHAIEAGLVEAGADFAELGQVIAGRRPGRRSARDVTLCDLTGTGAQDTAIAGLAFQRAQRMGKGFRFSS